MDAKTQKETLDALTWNAVLCGTVSTIERDGQLTYTKTYVNGHLKLSVQRVNDFWSKK